MRAKQCKRNERHEDYKNLTQRASSQSVLSQLQVSCVFFQKISIELPVFPLNLSCSVFCLFLPKISPFFQPHVLFLFMQASHAPCSRLNHHFLLSHFNHPPPQLLICSTTSIAAMASGWSHPCHVSHACRFMEVVPHFKKISSAHLRGDIKYPLVLLIKAIIINTRVGLQKEGVYKYDPLWWSSRV